MMQEALPIIEIMTLNFLILVLIGLGSAIAGTTFAIATRHLTNRNWQITQEDVWYYVLAGGLTIGLSLYGFPPAQIFIVTAGVNTPLGLVRNIVDKKIPPTGEQIAKPLRSNKPKTARPSS